ncbi:hypothetical protein ACFQ60_09335 [Streptomyces zhihengii]
MRATDPAALLATWEAGLTGRAADRSLLLHLAARPGADTGELLAVPVGEREADLFALRRALFGDRMQVRVACGACDEEMEFDLDAGVLGARPDPPPGPLRVAEDGWEVEFALPTVAALEAAASAGTRPRHGGGWWPPAPYGRCAAARRSRHRTSPPCCPQGWSAGSPRRPPRPTRWPT